MSLGGGETVVSRYTLSIVSRYTLSIRVQWRWLTKLPSSSEEPGAFENAGIYCVSRTPLMNLAALASNSG